MRRKEKNTSKYLPNKFIAAGASLWITVNSVWSGYHMLAITLNVTKGLVSATGRNWS